MKNLLITGMLVGATILTVNAQERERHVREVKTPEQVAEAQTKRLTEKLSLTEVQQEQVYALHLEKANEHKAIREERAERMKAQREKRTAASTEAKKAREASVAQLNEILTPEQQVILEKERAERASKFAENRKGEGKGKFQSKRGGKRGFDGKHKGEGMKKSPDADDKQA